MTTMYNGITIKNDSEEDIHLDLGNGTSIFVPTTNFKILHKRRLEEEEANSRIKYEEGVLANLQTMRDEHPDKTCIFCNEPEPYICYDCLTGFLEAAFEEEDTTTCPVCGRMLLEHEYRYCSDGGCAGSYEAREHASWSYKKKRILEQLIPGYKNFMFKRYKRDMKIKTVECKYDAYEILKAHEYFESLELKE